MNAYHSGQFKVDSEVIIYDRYRMAIPVEGLVVQLASQNDGVECRLTTTNNERQYPVGSCIWLSEKQLRLKRLANMDCAEAEMRVTALLAGQLSTIDSVVLLTELASRGGHPGALAEAALLCVRKSQDYNQGMGHKDIHKVDRSPYFPFGAVSYAQMLHTKSQRFISLAKKPEAASFEGLRDTALDIINYAGFFVAAQERKE
jgi:hypothetical protein